MIRWMQLGGPYMWVLSLLAAVVLGLSAKKAFDLFLRGGRDREDLARGLDAILFWGCISAVLGFLGQFTATYISLMIIRNAGIVDPSKVALGIAVSLITTIYGLLTLAVSALLWFLLRWRLSRLVEEGTFP